MQIFVKAKLAKQSLVEPSDTIDNITAETRKQFHQINSVLSLLEENWKMAVQYSEKIDFHVVLRRLYLYFGECCNILYKIFVKLGHTNVFSCATPRQDTQDNENRTKERIVQIFESCCSSFFLEHEESKR
jgi:hypothetical protein